MLCAEPAKFAAGGAAAAGDGSTPYQAGSLMCCSREGPSKSLAASAADALKRKAVCRIATAAGIVFNCMVRVVFQSRVYAHEQVWLSI